MTTPADIIEKYIALRNTKLALVAEHEAALKPYEQAMNVLENVLQKMMIEQNVTQFKAEGIGTAFQKTNMQVKLSDREQVINFVLREQNFDVFTNAVSKDF